MGTTNDRIERERIIGQSVYRQEDPDPFPLVGTVVARADNPHKGRRRVLVTWGQQASPRAEYIDSLDIWPIGAVDIDQAERMRAE